jgi:serralysin
MLTKTTVQRTGNVLVDSLTWGSKWTSGQPALNISVGFNAVGTTEAERVAMQSTLAEFERVINVKFTLVSSGASDLSFKIYSDTSSRQLGWSVPVGEALVAGFGDANILRNNYLNPEANLAKGSSDYVTFVHEFAHVMGLAHPHDAGGGSSIFPGVSGPNMTGYHGLNQGIFTTMSANDGWVTGPNAQTSTAFGMQSGLMALDILALQNLYGANLTTATGNDIYALAVTNGIGTGYTSIWDAGGNDTIVMNGIGGSTIDLRAATGKVELGGGGFISSANGVRGGFTIAAGVVIENATGGVGNDRIIGNSANNVLIGNAGNDLLAGNLGKDTLSGDRGYDRFFFATEQDSGPTMLSADVITDFDPRYDRIDLRAIDSNTGLAGNQAFAFCGFVSSFTDAAQIRAAYVSGNTVLYLNTDADKSTESVIVLNGIHLLAADDFLL